MVRNLSCNAEDEGLIAGQGTKTPGGENGNPLQILAWENSMDRGVWWAIVHGVTKSQIQLSTNTHTYTQREQTERSPEKMSEAIR